MDNKEQTMTTLVKHSDMAEAVAYVQQLIDLGATGRDAIHAAVIAYEVDEEALLEQLDLNAYYGA
jgi:hypothetical protein